jgi:hypothetical protein
VYSNTKRGNGKPEEWTEYLGNILLNSSLSPLPLQRLQWSSPSQCLTRADCSVSLYLRPWAPLPASPVSSISTYLSWSSVSCEKWINIHTVHLCSYRVISLCDNIEVPIFKGSVHVTSATPSHIKMDAPYLKCSSTYDLTIFVCCICRASHQFPPPVQTEEEEVPDQEEEV